MFCENCGKEIEGDVKFCPNCGAPTATMGGQKGPASGYQNGGAASSDPASSGPVDGTNAPTKRRRPKWWIFVIIAVVVVVVIIAIVFGTRSARAIDLNDYVTVEFEGYKGSGTADVTFDWDALSNEYDSKIKLNQSGWGDYYESFSDLLSDCVDMHVDPESGLSNGDEVTVSWDVDTEDLNDSINRKVKISAAPKTYTVSGLEEGGTFDAFEGISVEFSGISPEATATIEKSSDVPSQLSYSLDRSDGLSIGDTVTVRIDEESANAYMQESGLYPEEMTKSFSVEDVEYYVTSLDQIPEDALSKMDSEAEDSLNAMVASVWAQYDTRTTFQSMELLGYYFLTAKETASPTPENIIYLVYQVNILQSGSELYFYWYAGFDDGLIMPDGSYSMEYSIWDEPSDGIAGARPSIHLTSADGYETYYGGYGDLETAFNDLVIARSDEYTYESTVPE